MLIWEPYVAGFTGTLTTLVTLSGKQFTISHHCPRVVKGEPFMLQFDTEKEGVRMVRVALPPDWIGRTPRWMHPIKR